MATLEYCVSVWNYDRMATLLLSAFVLYPPQRHKLTVTVYYCRIADPRTAAVLSYFAANHAPQNVTWNFVDLEKRLLMRRAISRNMAAYATRADWLLFGDVDYIFRHSALDAAADAMIAASADYGPALFYPQYPMMSIDHDCGDIQIAQVVAPKIYDLDESLYAPKQLPRAIGGTQWAPGYIARKYGYLPDSKRFQRPADQWMRTYCDKAYRSFLASKGIPQRAIDVPHIYRIRHSKRGRFDVGVRL